MIGELLSWDVMGSNDELANILSSSGLIFTLVILTKFTVCKIAFIDNVYIKCKPSLIFQSSIFHEAHKYIYVNVNATTCHTEFN